MYYSRLAYLDICGLSTLVTQFRVYYSRLVYLDTVVCTYRAFVITEGYPYIYIRRRVSAGLLRRISVYLCWTKGIRRFITEGIRVFMMERRVSAGI